MKLQPGQKVPYIILWSIIYDRLPQVQNMVGTPEFMAPEVVNFDDISLETG